jgi:hypothetical protein
MDAVARLVTEENDLKVFCEELREQSSKTQEEGLAALIVQFRAQQALGKLATRMSSHAVAEATSVEQLLVMDSFYKKGFHACIRSMLINGFLSVELAPVLSEVSGDV